MAQVVMALENVGRGHIRPVHARTMGEDHAQFVFFQSTTPFPNLVHTVIVFTTSNLALLVGIFIYFPAHLVYLRERTIYYLCGTNSAVFPDCTMSLLYE